MTSRTIIIYPLHSGVDGADGGGGDGGGGGGRPQVFKNDVNWLYSVVSTVPNPPNYKGLGQKYSFWIFAKFFLKYYVHFAKM